MCCASGCTAELLTVTFGLFTDRTGRQPVEWRKDLRTSELILSLAVRSVFGIGAGVGGALVGYFVGWFFVLPPGASMTAALITLTVTTGMGGGVGAFPGWVDLDAGKIGNLPTLALTLLGGIGGAWAGLLYAQEVFDARITGGEGDITAIAAAGVAANLLTLVLFAVRGLRGGRGPE